MTRTWDLWIDGEWVAAAERVAIVDPFRGGIVGHVALAGEAELDRAAEAAADAFVVTRGMAAWERARALRATAAGLYARRLEAAETLVAEAGKPRRLAEAEVAGAVQTLELAAGEAERQGGAVEPGDLLEGGEPLVSVVRRVARGPARARGRADAPLAGAARALGAALSAGASVILEPDRRTPLSALLLADVADRAGVPNGAFGVVVARPDAEGRLERDRRLVALPSPVHPNASAIVHRDADWAWSLDRVTLGAFAHAGQPPGRIQRVLVDDVVADEWIDAFVARADDLRMGDPRDEGTVVGPLIDDRAAAVVEARLVEATERGGRLLTGGERDGRFVRPAVLVDVPGDSALGHDLAGPVVVLTRYPDLGEALGRLARRRAPVGLFTHDVRRIAHAARHLPGPLTVNVDPLAALEGPAPGRGADGLRAAIEALTEPRVLVVDARH